jgi:hypothetical protein
MNPKSPRSLLVLAVAMLACESPRCLNCGTTGPDSLGAMRVLFVGNSLT